MEDNIGKNYIKSGEKGAYLSPPQKRYVIRKGLLLKIDGSWRLNWEHLRERCVEGNADAEVGEDNERDNGENGSTNELDDDMNSAIVDTERKTTLNNDPGPPEHQKRSFRRSNILLNLRQHNKR